MTCSACSSAGAPPAAPSANVPLTPPGDGVWSPFHGRLSKIGAMIWNFFSPFCPIPPTLTVKSSWLIQRTSSPFQTCWDCVFVKVEALLKFAFRRYFTFLYLFKRKVQRLALSASCEPNRRWHQREHRLIAAHTLLILLFFFPRPSDCKHSPAAFHDRDLSTSANFNYY